MDKELTIAIGKWLEQQPEERDLEKGALYLLKITRNAIAYRNMSCNLPRYAETIEYQLQKHYNFRVREVTHEEVQKMESQVEIITKNHNSFREKENNEEFKKGKRSDHDELPEEIQALFVENLGILHKMREAHLQLRYMSNDKSNYPCKDSDRYPYLQQLIELDVRMHKNWEAYDHFKLPEPKPKKTAKTATKKVAAKTKAKAKKK